MAQLISLPAEILKEICLQILFITPSDIPSVYSIAPNELDDCSREWKRRALIAAYSNSKVLSSSFVADIHTLHNCGRGEAEYLYWDISMHCCPFKFLVPLNLTCRRLHEVVEPLLWKLVQTDQDSVDSGVEVARILHTVCQRPELGGYVKALVISLFDIESCVATRFDPVEGIKILRWDEKSRVAALLNLLPNLRNLKIFLKSMPGTYYIFESLELYESGVPFGLQNLTEFSLCWEETGYLNMNAEDLLQLFLLPNLKTLYLGYPILSLLDWGPWKFAQYYGMSKVTDLVMDIGRVQHLVIDELLKIPAALRRFSDSYKQYNERFEFPSAGILGRYLSALRRQKESLRSLQIREYKNPQHEQYRSAPDPTLLRSFTSLTEFACPVRLLFFRDGDLEEENFKLEEVLREEDYKLEEVFPPNIEELTLFARDDWPLDDLLDELKNFFLCGKERYRKLKKLTVECWLNEQDYEGYGSNGVKREEMEKWGKAALGSISARVESLKVLGADNGVILEVKVDTLCKGSHC